MNVSTKLNIEKPDKSLSQKIMKAPLTFLIRCCNGIKTLSVPTYSVVIPFSNQLCIFKVNLHIMWRLHCLLLFEVIKHEQTICSIKGIRWEWGKKKGRAGGQTTFLSFLPLPARHFFCSLLPHALWRLPVPLCFSCLYGGKSKGKRSTESGKFFTKFDLKYRTNWIH